MRESESLDKPKWTSLSSSLRASFLLARKSESEQTRLTEPWLSILQSASLLSSESRSRRRPKLFVTFEKVVRQTWIKQLPQFVAGKLINLIEYFN